MVTLTNFCADCPSIRSVHPLESVIIIVFWGEKGEPAGRKGGMSLILLTRQRPYGI